MSALLLGGFEEEDDDDGDDDPAPLPNPALHFWSRRGAEGDVECGERWGRATNGFA